MCQKKFNMVFRGRGINWNHLFLPKINPNAQKSRNRVGILSGIDTNIDHFIGKLSRNLIEDAKGSRKRIPQTIRVFETEETNVIGNIYLQQITVLRKREIVSNLGQINRTG